jgi:psiF repeat-containing protein
LARTSYHVWAVMMLLLATSLTSGIDAKTPQAKPAQSSTVSQQDKAKACDDLADKKGLKGQDRKTFMQSCLNKAVNSGSGGNVSQHDKATACKNLADKKGLTGEDRRSFVKHCMNKANPH